ncbi:MAG: DNA cytosine methyltransferase [Desulfovibrio sp.]|uniref:DNA cytosine methyltransferase n=1 Tax=Desulfovibrio sp. TaxID=885 RepID=UPI00135DBF87|nr:DNA cytosine methyltransferase [Desulfovibrio sp.]MTJ94032.1 DNA cytosine methyltransferase [Desulfovibrio sp.]
MTTAPPAAGFPIAQTNAVESISLFSGIAGFELGMEPYGLQPIMFCEIEPAAQSVLSLWRPDVPLHQDVRLLDQLPRHGRVLVGGFPCTDVSQAGRTEGIFGQKSGLVRDVFRLLALRKVETVILENVVNLIHLAGGEGLAYITSQFDALGYRWAYRVIDTLGFGLPQRRRRIFIVACLEGDPCQILFADDAGPLAAVQTAEIDLDQHALGFYWTEGNKGLGAALNAIPPLKGGSTIGINSAPAILLPDGQVGTPDIRDAERLQGLPADWTLPAEDVKKGSRWMLTGNAVTKDIPAWIASRMANPGPALGRQGGERRGGQRWPNAAWGKDGRVMSVDISENPLGRPLTRIQDFLAYPLKPLTERQTAGFLARASASSLRFPPRFIDRLRAHLSEIRAGACSQMAFAF